MKRTIAVTDEYPLHDGKPNTYPYGTLYLIGERVAARGKFRTIGEVSVTDATGHFEIGTYDTDKVPGQEFEFTTDVDLCEGTVGPGEVALRAMAMVLRPSAETEAAVLVALGEDGFANI